MKNDNNRHKKHGHWTGTLVRIIRNCPYLTAMVASSLAVIIYSDEIGLKAIAGDGEALIRQSAEIGVHAEELPSEKTVETDGKNLQNLQHLQNSEDSKDLESLGNMNPTDVSKLENAGECRTQNNEIESDTEHNDDSVFDLNRDNIEEMEKGITRFEYYEPVRTDSYYYSDAGKVALTTDYPYTKEDISYFNDAVFIGDSRTMGIYDYAGFDEADFYCENGMTILNLLDANGVTNQKTGKKEDLNQVLQQKHYGKIYIMLGMNDLGYGTTDMYLERYRNVVNQFREWQPDALIYIMANLHVSREKNNPETEFNNININDKNAASATLANGSDIFYLDANPLFTDPEGFLNAELSFDGVHLYAKHYDAWREFLLEHAVELKHLAQLES